MPNLKGGMQFVDGSDRHTYGWDNNNWAPRFGFAYKLSEKTVMRGGYGDLLLHHHPRRGGQAAAARRASAATPPGITNYMGDGADALLPAFGSVPRHRSADAYGFQPGCNVIRWRLDLERAIAVEHAQRHAL